MTSDHHHLLGTTSTSRMGGPDEELESEKLWQDFQSCASSVTKMYKDSSWKTYQTSAVATTQLYKTAVDVGRKGFEKGLAAGRTMLAKELLSKMSSSGKVDINILLEHLYCNMGLRTDEPHGYKQVMDNDTLPAVFMFQQALSGPNVSAAPNKNDLTNFLDTQVRRRKRQRSPSSPSQLYKKSKRC